MELLEEVGHCFGSLCGLPVLKLQPVQKIISSWLPLDKDVELCSFSTLCVFLHNAIPLTMVKMGLASETVNQPQLVFSIIKVALIMVFHHSNKTINNKIVNGPRDHTL